MEIAVRSPAGNGAFITLDPRQPLTATPYALALRGLRTTASGDANFPESWNVIGGHADNSVEPDVAGATIAGGGFANTVFGDFGTVSGGASNTASGSRSTVGGGSQNDASGDGSTVGGGDSNTASGAESTVGGGLFNTASDAGSTVGGGLFNSAIGLRSTVGGGDSNTASGDQSTVGGGAGNIASGFRSMVGGGQISTASGSRSMLPGGELCVAGGDYSLAAGRRAIVRDSETTGDNNGDEGSFVWADSANANFTSTGPDQFLIRAGGGVGVGTSSPSNQLSVNGNADFIGNVGIGTDSPSNQLSVNGNADFIGNVGIGTDSPSNQLSVNGNADFIGNVGIGTTAPAADLHIRGVDTLGSILLTPSLAQSNSQLFLAEQQSTSFGMIMRYDGAANQLHFVAQQSGVETAPLVSIDRSAGGNVGIGTTAPGFKLEVNGSAGKPGGGSWSNSSDRRLKENIASLQDSLDKLMQLRGVTYEYIDPQSINELAGQRIGVIAQEVERVFPDWVDQRSDGYKAVTFRGFEALTVEALRELRQEKDTQIEKLQAEITELRDDHDAEVSDLRQSLASLESAVTTLVAQSTNEKP